MYLNDGYLTIQGGRELSEGKRHSWPHFPVLVVIQIPLVFFILSTSRKRLCKQRNTHLVPLACSAPQGYWMTLASPLHFGSIQSLQTLQQSVPSASVKEMPGG